MANTSITEKALLTAIINGETLTDAHKEKAQAMLDAIQKKADKRKANGTRAQKENAEIKATITEMLEIGTVYTAKEIAKLMDVSTQKASALLGQMVKEGTLEKSEVKAKSGKVIGYSLIAESKPETEDDTENGEDSPEIEEIAED